MRLAISILLYIVACMTFGINFWAEQYVGALAGMLLVLFWGYSIAAEYRNLTDV